MNRDTTTVNIFDRAFTRAAFYISPLDRLMLLFKREHIRVDYYEGRVITYKRLFGKTFILSVGSIDSPNINCRCSIIPVKNQEQL